MRQSAELKHCFGISLQASCNRLYSRWHTAKWECSPHSLCADHMRPGHLWISLSVNRKDTDAPKTPLSMCYDHVVLLVTPLLQERDRQSTCQPHSSMAALAGEVQCQLQQQGGRRPQEAGLD
jgi:hypothetical protein